MASSGHPGGSGGCFGRISVPNVTLGWGGTVAAGGQPGCLEGGNWAPASPRRLCPLLRATHAEKQGRAGQSTGPTSAPAEAPSPPLGAAVPSSLNGHKPAPGISRGWRGRLCKGPCLCVGLLSLLTHRMGAFIDFKSRGQRLCVGHLYMSVAPVLGTEWDWTRQ